MVVNFSKNSITAERITKHGNIPFDYLYKKNDYFQAIHSFLQSVLEYDDDAVNDAADIIRY